MVPQDTLSMEKSTYDLNWLRPIVLEYENIRDIKSPAVTALHRNSAILSFWPFLDPIKISWRYLKQFNSYRVDKQTPTHPPTNQHYWKQSIWLCSRWVGGNELGTTWWSRDLTYDLLITQVLSTWYFLRTTLSPLVKKGVVQAVHELRRISCLSFVKPSDLNIWLLALKMARPVPQPVHQTLTACYLPFLS